MKDKPEKKFKAGSITAIIWKNKVKDMEFRTVQIQRSYKDKNEWKTTSSFRVNDLPKIRLVIDKAYEYIVMNKPSEEISEDLEKKYQLGHTT